MPPVFRLTDPGQGMARRGDCMGSTNSYQPMVEITRNARLESLHRGAAAVVDARGKLVASLGNPKQPIYLRSAAKPFQALALVCSGAADAFAITDEELAVICGSHSGEARHIALLEGLLRRTGVRADQLHCGIHPPFDAQARRALVEAGLSPTVLHNNCSGKHAGMLITAKHLGLALEDYADPEHGVQTAIRGLLAFLAGLEADEIETGIDGCAVPSFYMPMRSFSLAMARLAAAGEGIGEVREEDEELEEALYDEEYEVDGTAEGGAEDTAEGGEADESLPVSLPIGLARIWRAMIAHPVIFGGSRGRLDTDLMRVAAGNRVPLVAKSGAEGVYTVGVVCRGEAYGITLKIEDGAERARNSAAIEILHQLDLLPEDAIDQLSGYHQPVILTRRDEAVGEVNPIFRLNRGLPA
jgi:L-asparaginase II